MSDNSSPTSLPPFPPDYRASGVLLHVTSLPSPYGIGDVGPAARAWIDRLHDAGQTWWQALPLGPDRVRQLAVSIPSSFAGNPLLISPDVLMEDGPCRPERPCAATFSRRRPSTTTPSSHSNSGCSQRPGTTSAPGRAPTCETTYEQFCNEQPHWLDDYALFRGAKARHQRRAYYLEWPAELVSPRSGCPSPGGLPGTGRTRSIRFCWAQFLLFRQGERLKEHARARGVRLIGDLPFFVSPDSSDVWANPEHFLLDLAAQVDALLWPACRRITSAPRGSSGATRSIN